MQSAAIVAKKLLVDDKITACVKQIFSLVTYVKFGIEKTLSAETFCFLEKRLLPIFKFRPSSNLLSFYEMLIGPQPTFLECAVIFLLTSIGQLCQNGPANS